MSHPPGSGDTLFKHVTDRIAIAILSGELVAGALVPMVPVPGADIAPSRSVYREALKYLSAKGLIEARQRSGTRVAPRAAWNLLDPDILRWALAGRIDEEFVRHLYELRLFIEPNAARLAAERRTEEQLATLEHALHGMGTHPPFSDAIIQSDIDFHAALLDAAGNPAVTCMKSMITSTLLWSVRMQAGRQPGSFNNALVDHERVARAIAARNGGQAFSFMSALVMQALEDTLIAFRRPAGDQVAALTHE